MLTIDTNYPHKKVWMPILVGCSTFWLVVAALIAAAILL